MALLTIGGVALPDPTEYKVTLQDLDSDNTTRSETGKLHRDRIRAGIYKIEVSWVVTKAELKIITDAVAPARFSVSFFDPTKANYTTAQMYAGDRSGGLKVNANANVGNASIWSLSCSLTEY